MVISKKYRAAANGVVDAPVMHHCGLSPVAADASPRRPLDVHQLGLLGGCEPCRPVAIVFNHIVVVVVGVVVVAGNDGQHGGGGDERRRLILFLHLRDGHLLVQGRQRIIK